MARPSPAEATKKRESLKKAIESTRREDILMGEMPLGPAGFGRGVLGLKQIAEANIKSPEIAKAFGRGKGFGEQAFKTIARVRVHFGSGEIYDDAVKGMSKAHAMWRAALNWPNAIKIERLP